MQSKLNKIPVVEHLFDLDDGTTSFEYLGREVSILWLNSYQSTQSLYSSRYALIDHNIILVFSSGDPSVADIWNNASHLKKIIKTHHLSRANLIWDVRDFDRPSIKVRQTLLKANQQLNDYLANRYVIIPKKYKSLLRIFTYLYDKKVDNIHFLCEVDEALYAVMTNQHGLNLEEYRDHSFAFTKEALMNKSKEELVELIEKYKERQEQSNQYLLKTIGQITWDGNFNVAPIFVAEDDPHYELANALDLLQHDVQEIIAEYRELNKNLELKVAERIVDFIDKESNLRAILDHSDRVTWLMNSKLEIIDFNIAFTNEIKRRYRKIPKIGQSIFDIIAPGKESRIWKERINSALKGKPGIYLEQDNFDEEGHVWEIKTFPIREVGNIKGVSVFIEDITPLKESQFKLIEKNRALEKVNSELDSFVYRVSHDLRAPLTSILGLISLMKIETHPQKIEEYIGLQEKSIQKLDLFIKEIINLSRNSRLGITVSKINFSEIINEIFESQHYTEDAKKVERICEIDENVALYTDRNRLSIILTNLISNSLKYINKFDAHPYVKVKVHQLGDECVIEVSDNGIGIEENYLPKIFEMFFRATQQFSGSGLGLYIVKETAEKLQGTITVKSKIGQGTSFKLIIPSMEERYQAAKKSQK